MSTISSFTVGSGHSAAYMNNRPPAKTRKVGFLHLPDEARKRIYELAIYDHERGLVFLPRALPRKVCWDGAPGDANVSAVHEDEEPSLCRAVRMQPISNDGTGAAGVWTDGELADVEVISISDNTNSDVQSTDTVGYAETELQYRMRELDEENVSCEDCLEMLVERGQDLCHDACECGCHRNNSSDESDDDTNPESMLSSEDSEPVVYARPPFDCRYGYCTDKACEFCAGYGLAATQNEGNYIDEPDVDAEWQRQDDECQDDDEHFDSEECIGMLYEGQEPSILLASTEIRAQCLPIYYGNNIFAWRFFWRDYRSSFERFGRWTEGTVGTNAKYVIRLYLEGRHVIEEGVGFGADIGRSHQQPYFTLNIHNDSGDMDIADALEQDLLLALNKFAKGADTTALTPEDLSKLGSVFIRAMHRDPESVEYDASESHYAHELHQHSEARQITKALPRANAARRTGRRPSFQFSEGWAISSPTPFRSTPKYDRGPSQEL